jgi:hypothetical protein
VFSPDNATGLHRLRAGSGTPEPLTKLGQGHDAHRWPQFLPGGNLLLFVRSTDAEIQGIYAISLAAPHDVRQIRRTSASEVYSSGMLLYVVEERLVAQTFDANTRTVSGEPIPLGVRVSESSALVPACRRPAMVRSPLGATPSPAANSYGTTDKGTAAV